MELDDDVINCSLAEMDTGRVGSGRVQFSQMYFLSLLLAALTERAGHSLPTFSIVYRSQ